MAARRRVLSIMAASGKVGYLLLENRRVVTKGLSRKASIGEAEAATSAAHWIEQLRPDVVVTEHIPKRSRKGANTRAVTDAIAGVAELADLRHVRVVRGHSHANKFVEAAALAKAFPELAPLLPAPRKPWDSEPKPIIYFEALALALSALGDPDNPML